MSQDFPEIPIDPEIQSFDDAMLSQRIEAIKSEAMFLRREHERYQSIIREATGLLEKNRRDLENSKRLPLLVATVSEFVEISEDHLNLNYEVTATTKKTYERQLKSLIDRDSESTAKNTDSSLEAMLKEEEFADSDRATLGLDGEVTQALRSKPSSTVTEGVIIKTSSKTYVFLASTGAVPRKMLRPTDLVAVNKDTYFIYEKLPSAVDARVKTMEVTERPMDKFEDLGGIDQQISQIKESFLLPLQRPDLLKKIGIKPSKGVLLYGVPGTGKTALARALAHEANCSFLQLTATQLVQLYIGDGSAMVIETFNLAKSLIEKERTLKGNMDAGCIIYIDEIDAIGGRRSDTGGYDRDSTRTMLTLLNCLDGFDCDERIKVLASTNRVDILDPALTRSGRFDRKIEFTYPNEKGRYDILCIHSKKIKLIGRSDDPETCDRPGAVGLQEIAKSTNEYSGAMLKAVCMEAGLVCLRRHGEAVVHEDFVEAINIVSGKREGEMSYFI
ncbi:26S protease regulatory subunit 6A [Giardia duodenalis]|uniref:26S protease regulatory subunit 6A n=1 Tax=Giardia intestinalis (strain ATCC 50803 / WB clone C6) TaxID=184922 RepID=A8BN33_GIAIC|nr:26S protease regulatory subunit 6A [Giardia intestinalis]KAE8305555.1 26S protease regulatory subunit 6A [Giardia intestinalis]|eukprot:XP_001706016.1 26S protease regulatory subunit 6A [Giardia lamblia ATCC 50803]